jgi:vacuolar-type H+-ATPase subunit E/Vma4
MDQAASSRGPAVSAAAGEGRQKTPEEIEAEIEQTREELGDTVEALAEKSDVKAQAKNKIAEVRDTAQHKKDEIASRAREATPDSAGSAGKQLASTVKRKPVPFAAAGAFAGGVFVGWILRRR